GASLGRLGRSFSRAFSSRSRRFSSSSAATRASSRATSRFSSSAERASGSGRGGEDMALTDHARAPRESPRSTTPHLPPGLSDQVRAFTLGAVYGPLPRMYGRKARRLLGYVVDSPLP